MSESAPNVLSRPRSSTLGRRTFADLLSDSPTIEIRPGAARPRAVFGEAAFVVIEDGFVVIRATLTDAERSVVTGEGGPGTTLLPPSAHETRSALSRSLVTSSSRRCAINGRPCRGPRSSSSSSWPLL